VMLPLAVLAGGKLIGVIAYDRANFQMAGLEWPQIYLLSDFSTGTQPRLAKLVAAAATSKEGALLLENKFSRRFRSVATTAFTNNPVSMKYRGFYRLLTRLPGREGKRYALTYGADLGKQTLKEILQRWKENTARAGASDRD
jgi:hypothetical protein